MNNKLCKNLKSFFSLYILAYGVVYLVRKKGGIDHNQLYAMKVLKKSSIVLKKKTAEHTRTERQVSLISLLCKVGL